MAVKGNIDMVADGHIFGWAWDEATPDLPLRVIACANGHIISSSIANLFREDLKTAGIGNGEHGFELILPRITLEANSIHILEEESHVELHGSPIIQKKVENQSLFLRIIIDVTDLLLFLDKNNNLTGISRVQIEILKAICRHGLFDLSRLELVAMSYVTRKFETVNKGDLFAFIDKHLLEESDIKLVDVQGVAHIDRFIRFTPFNPDDCYCREAVFLSLGSAWGIPDFFAQVHQFLEKGMRLILLYHDIIPLVRPDLAPAELADIFNIFVRNSFIFCDALLAVSRHCANDIAEFARRCGHVCPPISVAGNGITTTLPMDVQPFVDDPYVLVVSTIEGRKNHIVLARAWQKLLDRYGERTPKLLFVGAIGLNIKPLFDFLKETSCLDGHIQIFGKVSDSKLASLYKGCLFTAYPSLYEGWGLPVTESLAFGKPCLCSRASALPEAGLDYCVYFDAEDVDDAMACAEKLIFDTDFKKALEDRIAKEYAPPQWQAIASGIIAKVRDTGKLAHKRTPVIPQGIEVAFWLPHSYPLGDERSILKAVKAFSEGYLTDTKLTWDNYCLGCCLVTSGCFYPRTVDGWYGDPDGNTFRIEIEESTRVANASLYLLFELEKFPQDIEFYRESDLIQSLAVTSKTGFAHLQLKDFKINQSARIFIKSAQSKPIIYKSLLVLDNDDIKRRVTVQEKLFNLRLTGG